ncbi:MAG: ABC transporter ATP-binding protein [Ardenticatenia bacterium]|nr:ABC transporter ATP-binding protein [Ardenticatenia bacterium]
MKGVSLEIPPRGIYGLLGPNGAGKTTFLRLAAALMEPTQGRVLVGGYNTAQEGDRIRRLIGYLPQEYELYPALTGWEFLDYMALLSGVSNREHRIRELLAWVGLEHVAHKRLCTYSGGMKQRLALAQALLTKPPILLLDEPTTGLDPEERLRFKDWLLDYAQEHTVVFSSHLVEDIALLCDHVAVLRRGRVRYQGPVADLVKVVEGKVWGVLLPRERRRIQVDGVVPIATRVLEDDPERVEVRFLWLADDPPPVEGAQPVRPTLQDAYVHLQQGSDE